MTDDDIDVGTALLSYEFRCGHCEHRFHTAAAQPDDAASAARINGWEITSTHAVCPGCIQALR
ncbi:hypothetical protein [Antrihabitans cavernicola]|uniref:Uncharacterized protein n=1 Tax=Antrihabitans cavernicola TaxID=2495913 RepID=A0A5A7S4F6_9NOCA|nr:hypothetical protein [Spelaeibacter cavernicola]KAA0017003.1 hypothetical protein FOY51_25510 [Spelaeibacter cavernicola]